MGPGQRVASVRSVRPWLDAADEWDGHGGTVLLSDRQRRAMPAVGGKSREVGKRRGQGADAGKAGVRRMVCVIKEGSVPRLVTKNLGPCIQKMVKRSNCHCGVRTV